MAQILEFLPIIVFFVVYQMDGTTIDLMGYSLTFDGIFSATLALMGATVIQVIVTRLLTGQIEKRLWWLLAIVLVMGTLTVGLRNAEFLYWKPTVFNWALALVFLLFGVLSDKNLLERAMGSQLQVPKKVLKKPKSFLDGWMGGAEFMGGGRFWKDLGGKFRAPEGDGRFRRVKVKMKV